MLEVCVDSIESALAAVAGGCTRLELCCARSEDGLTPTVGMLKVLKNAVKIPIFCMLRPRKGDDFCYSDLEMETILHDLEQLKSCGSDGFVFGSLDENRNICVEQCKQVLEKCGNLPATFHKAFDYTDPEKMHENCSLLKSLGFSRILTSGFKKTALDGIHNITELIQKHSDIIIMPGGGVTTLNIQAILIESNCKEIHSSASKTIQLQTTGDVRTAVTGADVELVRHLMQALKCHYSMPSKT